jgi:hypothetical protein
MKKSFNDNLFVNLDWVLKKNKEEPNDKNVSGFIFNRWISMSNTDNSNIVNLTTNRWMAKILDFPFLNFYKIILSKKKGDLKYIKKQNNPDTLIELNMISNNMEISKREIIFLEKALANLTTDSN